MKVTANVLVFIAALFIGGFSSLLFADVTGPDARGLTAQNLVGTWRGNFGRDLGDCTIEITRAEGDAVYGTLEKDGALVQFEGFFNRETRKFYFEETQVIYLDNDLGEWSLGRNSAVISADGRMLVGNGYDKWGQYSWAASSY